MEIYSPAVWAPSHQPVVESLSAVPVLLFLALAALLWVANRAGWAAARRAARFDGPAEPPLDRIGSPHVLRQDADAAGEDGPDPCRLCVRRLAADGALRRCGATPDAEPVHGSWRASDN